ncbi:hypothetical protein R1sor_004986 [Riccia sorocarpa]|uniref:DNA methylase N-4/N-6 domain-containing protein n=1 Tax=Riccia sorocarpa TaxID=122646 RepID=A0ABD3HI83_9MARC
MNGGFPERRYHDISFQDNKNNEDAHFVSSFVECLGQARRQWTALKRPKSVQGSNTKNTAFEVAKPTKYQGSEAVVSLIDHCKRLKSIKSLGLRVVKYWPSRYREVYDKWSDLEKAYNFLDKWLESMLKYIPEKGDKEVAADETSLSDVETDDGNTRRRKKGKKKSYGADPLPSQIASMIHRVYYAKRGESAPQRLKPLECFAVVAIMDFGHASVDFANALKDMKDARVTVDYGCYEVNRVHNRTDLPYPCWQLIYAFVSLVAEDYKLVLHQSLSLRPFLLEIQPSKWKEEVNVDEGDHAEGINVMDKAPRWEFVGMTFPDDSMSFVHPFSKRRTFCEKMIMNFSSEGDIVLDFFSGGVFTQEALLQGRDVVYYSSFESEFITKYSKALCKFSQRISDWFVQFGQGKKPAASTPVAAIAGDYHASSSDVMLQVLSWTIK